MKDSKWGSKVSLSLNHQSSFCLSCQIQNIKIKCRKQNVSEDLLLSQGQEHIGIQ